MHEPARATKGLLAILLLATITTGCFGPSDGDRIGQVVDDLILHIEGKDSASILRHVPLDPTRMRISMDSGDYSVEPDSLNEAEEALWDFATIFNGDDVNLTQENVVVSGDTARVSLTFKVVDQSWERTIPVRMDLRRQGDDWVLVSLEAFN